MDSDSIRNKLQNESEPWRILAQYFIITLIVPLYEKESEQYPYQDFAKNIAKYITGSSLNIDALMNDPLFACLFPSDRKELKQYKAELHEKLSKGCFDIIEFFLNKEDEKFVEGFNKMVKPELRISSATYELPQRFLEELDSRGIYLSYTENYKAYQWDFSPLSITHNYPTIYAAFRSYAHKWYTFVRIGAELSWFAAHENLQPLVSGVSLTEFLRQQRMCSLNGSDILYKHELKKEKEASEEAEARETEQRRKTILHKLELPEQSSLSLSELCYSVYTAFMQEETLDSYERGRAFLLGLLTMNTHYMDKTLLKYLNAYKALIENTPERVAYPITQNKYIPTSLEKLLWQIAGQVPDLVKDFKSIEKEQALNLRTGYSLLEDTLPFSASEAALNSKFLNDCYKHIYSILEEPDRNRMSLLFNERGHAPLRQLLSAVWNLLYDNKYGTSVRFLLNKKRIKRLWEIHDIMEPIACIDECENERHYKEEDVIECLSEASIKQVIIAFEEQFPQETAFLAFIARYVHDPRFNIDMFFTKKGKRTIEKELFKQYGAITDVTLDDQVIYHLFKEKIETVITNLEYIKPQME